MLLLLSNTVKMLPMHGVTGFLLRDEQPLLAYDLEDDHADERLYVESHITLLLPLKGKSITHNNARNRWDMP